MEGLERVCEELTQRGIYLSLYNIGITLDYLDLKNEACHGIAIERRINDKIELTLVYVPEYSLLRTRYLGSPESLSKYFEQNSPTNYHSSIPDCDKIMYRLCGEFRKIKKTADNPSKIEVECTSFVSRKKIILNIKRFLEKEITS